VDSVKRLSLDVKGAIMRLSNTKIDPSDKKINDAVKEGTFSQERLEEGFYEMSEEEKQFYSYNIPAVLVMNKVDLVTSKRRLKTLQDEMQDLCAFEKVFHISTMTGFGVDALKEYIIDKG
jgi:GTP-binding protein Era